eukprot:1144614-Prymnesium_polylepis.1
MPICDVTWPQSLVDPAVASSALRAARISMMRSAMPLHSPRHCASSTGSESTAATIRAPCTGGLEYMGRMMIFSCDSMRLASSASAHTNESKPTRSP